MAKRAEDAAVSADRVSRYRENVNFTYWKTRGEVEQQPEAVSARRHVYQAKQLQTDGELERALKEYEAAWTLWAGILEKNPSLMEQLMADDLLEDVQAYVKLLGQLELRLSSDFKLLRLLELNGELPEPRPEGSSAATTSDSPASSSNAEPAAPAPAANTVEPAAPASKPDTTEKPADSAATSAPAEVTPQPAAAAPTAADTPPPAPEASPAPAEAPPAPTPTRRRLRGIPRKSTVAPARVLACTPHTSGDGRRHGRVT